MAALAGHEVGESGHSTRDNGSEGGCNMTLVETRKISFDADG